MSVLVRTLESIDDVRGLEALLRDYIRFVCDDLMRASGVSFDADVLLANTLGSLEKVGSTFNIAVNPNCTPSGSNKLDCQHL